MNDSIITQFLSIFQKNDQVIYALNEIAKTNIITENQEVQWPPLRKVQLSYVLIRNMPNGTFYVQVPIRGQFGYGGIFKYNGNLQ
jgi:hypothetical protein